MHSVTDDLAMNQKFLGIWDKNFIFLSNDMITFYSSIKGWKPSSFCSLRRSEVGNGTDVFLDSYIYICVLKPRMPKPFIKIVGSKNELLK